MSTMTPVIPVAPFWAPAVWLRNLCELAISGYQRFLSPHKGYICAHRVVHRGESCSQFVKRAIKEGGVRQAWGLAQDRFCACGSAARRLTRQRLNHALRAKAQRAAYLGTSVVAVATCQDAKAEESKVWDACMELTTNALEIAPHLIESPDGVANLADSIGDTLSGAFEATGDVLSSGLDLLGSGCDALGGAAACAGGCAL